MRQHATGLDAILSDFDSNQFNCMMMMMMMVMMMMKFFHFLHRFSHTPKL